jgi:hypothetical protein
MNIKLCFLVLVALSVLVSACSRAGKDETVNMDEVIIMEDLSPEERAKLLSSSAINIKDNQYLADNLSRIERSRDNNGIKLEKQFYKNLPNIKYIAVHTFPNGSKQIIIYGANGSIKSLSENMMSEIIKATPDELTREIPVYSAENPNPNGGITIKSLPPLTNQPATIQTETAPVQTQATPPPAKVVEEPQETKPESETKPQEQPAAKETPAVTAAPKNPDKNLQFLPMKRKS